VALVLQSGSLGELLPRLRAHTLDLILSNRRVPEDADHAWRCVRIARQRVSLVGPPRRGRPFRFPADLADTPLVLPSQDSDIRPAFDLVCEQAGLRLNVVAEVDDMAMLRLVARNSAAVALVPAGWCGTSCMTGSSWNTVRCPTCPRSSGPSGCGGSSSTRWSGHCWSGRRRRCWR
jgi:LysR family transcriptional activator of nhaA